MSDPYQQALAKSGLSDVQPLYRSLLVQLKKRDGARYEAAVLRYTSDVESADPEAVLNAWVTYGAWLATELAPGQLVSIDENGRSRELSGPPPLGTLLMHVPDDARVRALVVTRPAKPSPAQHETMTLLCD